MSIKEVKEQTIAANENLARIKANFRLVIKTQGRRVNMYAGRPEKAATGNVTQMLFNFYTAAEASKFMAGFNACLAYQNIYSLPVKEA